MDNKQYGIENFISNRYKLDGSRRRKRRLCFGLRIESPLATKG